MVIRHLSLLHFRNYPALQHDFEPGMNLLVGLNAQGKSNLLEAVYLLATTKSMRGGRDAEMIEWDQSVSLVGGSVAREVTYDVELEVCLSRGEHKTISMNRARVPRVADYVGQLKAVAFSTADVDVVRGEPSLRRRFLDLEISQTSPAYCHTLASYRRVVEHRNRLLKQIRERGGRRPAEVADSLADWSEQLVRYGSRLVERRAQFLARLQEFARPIHSLMTRDQELLGISYACSFPLPEREGPEEVERAFRTALAGVEQDEVRRGACLVGPHRDEIHFLFNGRQARVYGSQAQQRTVMLSSKLAEVELIRDACGENPVCLLDDVLSELDEHRRSHLFNIIRPAGQVLLSGTDLEDLPAPLTAAAAVHRVQDGSVQRQ